MGTWTDSQLLSMTCCRRLLRSGLYGLYSELGFGSKLPTYIVVSNGLLAYTSYWVVTIEYRLRHRHAY